MKINLEPKKAAVKKAAAKKATPVKAEETPEYVVNIQLTQQQLNKLGGILAFDQDSNELVHEGASLVNAISAAEGHLEDFSNSEWVTLYLPFKTVKRKRSVIVEDFKLNI